MQQDLHATGVDRLFYFLPESLAREDVSVVIPRIAEEGAEAARRGADVGVVDVAINDVGDDPRRVDGASPPIGGGAQRQQLRALADLRKLVRRESAPPARPPRSRAGTSTVGPARPPVAAAAVGGEQTQLGAAAQIFGRAGAQLTVEPKAELLAQIAARARHVDAGALRDRLDALDATLHAAPQHIYPLAVVWRRDARPRRRTRTAAPSAFAIRPQGRRRACPSSPSVARNAASPMMSALCVGATRVSKRGFKPRAASKMRKRTTEVRELASSAMVSSSSIGRSATSSTEPTSARAPMQTPGAATRSPWRANAATGRSATSTNDSASRRAPSDGEHSCTSESPAMRGRVFEKRRRCDF